MSQTRKKGLIIMLKEVKKKIEEKIEKDRLRLLLIYPQASVFLNNMKIKDAKRKVFYHKEGTKVERFRLEVEYNNQVVNITQFVSSLGDKAFNQKVLVNGKFVSVDKVEGTSFEDFFQTSPKGDFYLQKFFNELGIEEICQLYKNK